MTRDPLARGSRECSSVSLPGCGPLSATDLFWGRKVNLWGTDRAKITHILSYPSPPPRSPVHRVCTKSGKEQFPRGGGRQWRRGGGEERGREKERGRKEVKGREVENGEQPEEEKMRL